MWSPQWNTWYKHHTIFQVMFYSVLVRNIQSPVLSQINIMNLGCIHHVWQLPNVLMTCKQSWNSCFSGHYFYADNTFQINHPSSSQSQMLLGEPKTTKFCNNHTSIMHAQWVKCSWIYIHGAWIFITYSIHTVCVGSTELYFGL